MILALLLQGADVGSLPICPIAYEVFASSKQISNLRSVAISSGAKVTEVENEPGDVGRFRAFIPTLSMDGADSVSKLRFFPNDMQKLGGFATPSSAKPINFDCRSQNWPKSGLNLPNIFYFEVGAEGARKMRSDMKSLNIPVGVFAGSDATIFRYVSEGGLGDPQIQSIVYRIRRADYGEVIVGAGSSFQKLESGVSR